MKRRLILSVCIIATVAAGSYASNISGKSDVSPLTPSVSSSNPNPPASSGGESFYSGGNDLSDAVPVVPGGPYHGTTAGYTDEFDFECPYPSYGASDVVYSLTVLEAGNYSFDVCEANFDTKIYLLDDTGDLITCNDDGCPDNPTHSYMDVMGLSAGTYYLVIDGFADDNGEYDLFVTHMIDCEPVICPDNALMEIEPNDGCANEFFPFFQNITLDCMVGAVDENTIICGEIWADTYLRDTDWYSFIIEEPAYLDVYIDVDEADPVIGLFAYDEVECYTADGVYFFIDDYGYCENEHLVTDELLPPGQYLIFIAHYTWEEEILADYVLYVDCEFETSTNTEISSFDLKQNYPNPFNPSTTIDYSIAEDAFVSLDVYNITGTKVMTLVSETQSAGLNSVTFDANSLASGMYFYTLTAGNQTATRKMVLLK